MATHMNARIGIALGDVTGVGPEVTLKALAALPADDPAKFLVIGDEGWLAEANRRVRLSVEPWREGSAARVCVLQPADSLPPKLRSGAPEAAQAAISWLREGAARCLRRELAALVTAPVSKEAIIRSGQPFVGQTEFLAGLAGGVQPVMMLLGDDDRGRWLRVALATTHVPMRELANQVTREKVELAVKRAAEACRDLGLSRARVAVCGLNPHAGEGGHLGTEELTTIGPAVAAVRERGFDVVGPLAADTVFHHALRGDFDAVVAMYHDQGLAPLKMLAFDNGVNWTLGLPFIRTSPDHGTAYDIAGRNRANASSMVAAIRLARQLATTKRAGP